MIVNILDDPIDILYPLDNCIFDNPKIVYHGTCSSFSKMIESTGWQINNPPYDIDDVKYVCECYNSLGIQNDVYGTLRHYTLGMSNGETNYPRFTKNYWIARNFASFKCGETISSLVDGVEELVSNRELSREKIERLRKLKQKYRDIFQNSFGVVYVIDVEPDWFSNWGPMAGNIETNEPNIDLILIENLPPENIKAKIEFHNGITSYRPDYDYPLPLLRTLDSFRRDINNSKHGVDDSILERYSITENNEN